MSKLKWNIARYCLSVFVTGTLVLPLTHAAFHVKLKLEQQAQHQDAPFHTHSSEDTIGKSCDAGSAGNLHCPLCTLTPARALVMHSDAPAALQAASFHSGPPLHLDYASQTRLAIRGPPHLA